MNGTSTTSRIFSPEKILNRATIVTMLHRLEGEPKAEKAAEFPDVAAGVWYTDAVAWAAGNKIVLGYTSGKYGPTDNLTNEQLAAILYGGFELIETPPNNVGGEQQEGQR